MDKGHSIRLKKLAARLEFLKERFGVVFPEKEIKALHDLSNPGKPHLGNLMVKYKYAGSREEAIRDFINKKHFSTQYLSPKEAIEGILASGGVPVLAHPFQYHLDDAGLRELIEHCMESGLEGMECRYSGYDAAQTAYLEALAAEYGLVRTGGSDFHGAIKGEIRLGEGKGGLNVPYAFLEELRSRRAKT